ncbi:MAG: response regulator [Planctomycetaceae bacterium]|nr:response regulator [Planctomycetaceae bacterium]
MEQGGGRQPAVLIVEDDLDTRANLQDVLELDGYESELFSSVGEVLAAADLTGYLAILLDRRLPDGSGDELLPYLQETVPEIPVILITGYADLEAAVTALRNGAVDFLPKPIDSDLLRSRLRRIGEELRMREELAEAQRKLIESARLAAIGQTVASISHEARNELFAMDVGLEMLAEMLADRPQQLKVVGRLREGRNRLNRHFEELRSFASPIHLERTISSVREIWRSAWSSLESIRRNRDTSLKEEIGDVNLTLPVDEFRLEQVFRNLFENSLAACPDPVEISVICAQPPGCSEEILLTIRDNGPGLTPEQQQKVFDPFYTTRANGTGLGMTITKRIVEAHDGTISAVATSGRGAEFRISLPFSAEAERSGIRPAREH